MRQMQKLWQGLVEAPQLTTCRIARRVIIDGDQMCAYAGANGTTVAIYNNGSDFCPSHMQCKYSPFGNKTIAELVTTFKNSKD